MLTTRRLMIVQYTPDMADDLHCLSMEAANRAALPDEVFETTEDAARIIELFLDEYEGDRGPFVYAVTLRDGTYIGHVEAALTSGGDWEVGFHIGQDYAGNGYAAEALEAFLPFICEKLRLGEILGICLEENIASWKTLERCGFVLEYAGAGRYQGRSCPIRRYVWTVQQAVDIDGFWQDFIRAEGLHPRTEYREAFCFDENDVDEQQLGLVLAGKKTARCFSAAYWEWLEEPDPEPGDFTILTDRSGTPRCILETMDVHTFHLDQMPWELAALEGEDAGPEAWLARHTAGFEAEAKRLRRDFAPDMDVLLEVFEVVHKL